jgi:RimJ/RimL family protein N-acetyltransferase
METGVTMAASSPSAGKGVLATERLILRGFTKDDVDAIFSVLGDEEAMKYYPRKFTREDAAQWIDRNLQRYRNDGYGLWAMVLKSTGEVIGDCGITRQVVEGEPMLEVGYHLRRDHWGHGYATEAARACMTYAFHNLAAGRVVSLIVAENLPSRRVAERNGMTVERQVTFHELPHLLYAMKREDYGQA